MFGGGNPDRTILTLPLAGSFVTKNVTENVIENVIDKLPDGISHLMSSYSNKKKTTAERIAVAIQQDGKKTLQQIADETGITPRTVARYTKEFQEAGVLQRIGSDISGEWILS